MRPCMQQPARLTADRAQVAALAMSRLNKNAHVLSWLRLMRLPEDPRELFLQPTDISKEALAVLARCVWMAAGCLHDSAGPLHMCRPCLWLFLASRPSWAQDC